jgi:Rieske Fe-S protein
VKRRTALDIFFGGSLIATIAAFLYPVVRYILPPKKAAVSEDSIVAAKAGELAPNSAKVFKFGAAPAILVNTPEGNLVALTAVCTHLTCNVRFDGETGTLIEP